MTLKAAGKPWPPEIKSAWGQFFIKTLPAGEAPTAC